MRIGIAGLGLIGGSLALALRERHEVLGYDVADEARESARLSGVALVERVTDLLPADVVIVATPIRSVLATLATLAPHADGAVLVDVASVRGPLEAFAQGSAARIVGMHPMAGRTGRGFSAADPSLFRGRPFLVVPTATSDAGAMALAGAIARDAGGVVVVCSAAQHDRLVAVLSALPLAVAAALSIAGDEAAAGRAHDVAGTGYRDATRLALTPEDLGEPLLTVNGPYVVAALARLRDTLDELERAVAERDLAAVRELLARARSARERLG